MLESTVSIPGVETVEQTVEVPVKAIFLFDVKAPEVALVVETVETPISV